MRPINTPVFLVCMAFLVAVARAAQFDFLIRNGTIYDGSGKAPVVGDVAISRDSIAAVGK